MKWGLKVSWKYLTPSSALRDSRLRSPWNFSAIPTSLCFSAGPRLLTWNTARSSQSSISSSYLNHEVGPSKSGGIFVVIPLAAVQWSDDSARYAPTADSAALFVFCEQHHLLHAHYHSLFVRTQSARALRVQILQRTCVGSSIVSTVPWAKYSHPFMIHPPSLLFPFGDVDLPFPSSPAPTPTMTVPRSVSTSSSPMSATLPGLSRFGSMANSNSSTSHEPKKDVDNDTEVSQTIYSNTEESKPNLSMNLVSEGNQTKFGSTQAAASAAGTVFNSSSVCLKTSNGKPLRRERESERQWMFSKWPNKISGQFYCC